jgi:programmed cell death protein 4
MSSPKLQKHDHATKFGSKPSTKGVHGAIKKVVEKRGGHRTWGIAGAADASQPNALNKSDPNWDDFAGATYVSESTLVNGNGKSPESIITVILVEFTESGDIDEAVADIKEHPLIEPAQFVALAVEFGLEHHNHERELVSQLLSACHALFEGRGYDEGFQNILFRLPDLVLDVPGAEEFVGLFIARAIFDDALAPAFIKNAEVDNEGAKLALNLAYNIVHEASERSRLENIWGPSAQTSVEVLREEAKNVVKEYLSSFDIAEADRAILSLNTPSFMSQVVKEALYLAIEQGNHKPRELVLSLLMNWSKSAIISDYHMKRGFDLAKKGLDEIRLDVPHVDDALASLVKDAEARKLV